MTRLFAERPPEAIEDVVRLASLLMTMESGGRPFNSQQYQLLTKQLAATLKLAPVGDALEAVLQAFPAAATVYENVRYEHAGLCRSPLERNLESERQAVAAIKRASAPRAANSGVRSTPSP